MTDQEKELKLDRDKLMVSAYNMREAQKRYFKHRTADALEKAKKSEKALDELLAALAKKDKPQQLTLLG